VSFCDPRRVVHSLCYGRSYAVTRTSLYLGLARDKYPSTHQAHNYHKTAWQLWFAVRTRNRSEPKACLTSLRRRCCLLPELRPSPRPDQVPESNLDSDEDEDPSVGLHRLMPARFRTGAGTPTARQALRERPLRSEYALPTSTKASSLACRLIPSSKAM